MSCFSITKYNPASLSTIRPLLHNISNRLSDALYIKQIGQTISSSSIDNLQVLIEKDFMDAVKGNIIEASIIPRALENNISPEKMALALEVADLRLGPVVKQSFLSNVFLGNSEWKSSLLSEMLSLRTDLSLVLKHEIGNLLTSQIGNIELLLLVFSDMYKHTSKQTDYLRDYKDFLNNNYNEFEISNDLFHFLLSIKNLQAYKLDVFDSLKTRSLNEEETLKFVKQYDRITNMLDIYKYCDIEDLLILANRQAYAVEILMDREFPEISFDRLQRNVSLRTSFGSGYFVSALWEKFLHELKTHNDFFR